MTNQPIWKLVANLGDNDPIEHGGLFVYEDTTGVYPPEIELLEPPSEEFADYSEDSNWSPSARWTVRRAVCEPCTYIDGVLSDNKHHPESAAWFADSVDSIAESFGMEASEFIRMLTAGSTVERAEAWRMIGDYHGWDNLDAYPIEWNHAQILRRVAGMGFAKMHGA
jgi:hypothetical protein